ncbi:MAG: PHP domain-containing protein [Candidatus Riflebacteria bacterium]|nr:PHP domain-containing protein [Candidatus Riflebacteria bacterium]
MSNIDFFADLHSHSTASDGTLTPTEMVREAKEAGLQVMALTDHDTLAGVAEALKAGRDYDVTVVPGVELSTGWEGISSSVHVLGLFISENPKSLKTILDEQREMRYARALEIVRRLRNAGLDMRTAEEDFAKDPDRVLGRPHIAGLLVEYGHVSCFKEAFARYLKRGCPGYVEKQYISPKTAVEAIHDAGGIAVIAHPGLTADFDETFKVLREEDFDGIESLYIEHSASQTERFANLAKEMNYVQTGGSDYHGQRGKHCNRFGNGGMTLLQYEKLLSECKEKGIKLDEKYAIIKN